jgi:hypothetical protein
MAKECKLSLWRLDSTVGTWRHERNVTKETATSWLQVFQRDAPAQTFVIACKKPVTDAEKQLRKLARERNRRG